MTLTPEAAKTLYSTEAGVSLPDQLVAAYERNLAEGLVRRAESARLAAESAITSAQKMFEKTGQSAPLFDVSAGIKAVAETALEYSEQLFNRIDINTPELSEFAESGINFSRLGAAHASMKKLGLEPELVIAPLLSAAMWSNLFQTLQDDRVVNPGGDRLKHGGLFIADRILKNWDKLQGDHHSVAVAGQLWQVMVMPAAQSPPLLNLDHTGTSVGGKILSEELVNMRHEFVPSMQQSPENMHPTISTYLTLLASKLQRGDKPLDISTFTWLDGTFSDTVTEVGTQAYWTPANHQIALDFNYNDFGDSNHGIRLPVWGEYSMEISGT
jgi:hypothetical protein